MEKARWEMRSGFLRGLTEPWALAALLRDTIDEVGLSRSKRYAVTWDRPEFLSKARAVALSSSA